MNIFYMSEQNPQSYKISRPLMHLLARYSTWTTKTMQQALNDKVYTNPAQLLKLLRYFLLAAGVSFLLSGIIFFFAYNWNNLSPFQKFALCETGIVTCVVIFFF